MRNIKSNFLWFLIGVLICSGVAFTAPQILDVDVLPIRIFFNGTEKSLPDDTIAFTYNDRTYVPLRHIAETLDKNVTWDEENKFIHINDKVIEPDGDYIMGNLQGNIVNYGLVVKDDVCIYYQSSKDKNIYKQRIDGSEKTKVNDDTSYDLRISGDWLYYKSGVDLYRIRTDGSEKTLLSKSVRSDFFIHKDWVYYESGISGMYRINCETLIEEPVYNGYYNNVVISQGYLYYLSGSGRWINLRRVDLLNFSVIETFDITEELIGIPNQAVIYNRELYFSTSRFEIYILNLDTLELTKADWLDRAQYLNIYKGWIYYSNENDEGKLYKAQLDGSLKTKLCDDFPAMTINIMDDWIYFGDRFDPDARIYKMKNDGANQMLVE